MTIITSSQSKYGHICRYLISMIGQLLNKCPQKGELKSNTSQYSLKGVL